MGPRKENGEPVITGKHITIASTLLGILLLVATGARTYERDRQDTNQQIREAWLRDSIDRHLLYEVRREQRESRALLDTLNARVGRIGCRLEPRRAACDP